MKTDEYLRQLSKYLKKLPKADYDDAMEYFTEYFAETDENEAKKLMDELGTPKEAACDIISNILEKKIDEKKQADSEKKQVDSDKKSVFGVLWIALLAIFALPVATPLLISGLIVMFCVLLCVVLAVLCVFLFGVCAAIAGMAEAFRECYENLNNKSENLYRLRNNFIKELEKLDNVIIHGSLDTIKSAPHIISASFIGVRSEVMLHTLESKGIYVSAGSACSSHKRAGSDTLTAIGLSKEEMESNIRFSLDDDIEEEHLQYCLSVIREVLPMLRKYQPH